MGIDFLTTPSKETDGNNSLDAADMPDLMT